MKSEKLKSKENTCIPFSIMINYSRCEKRWSSVTDRIKNIQYGRR